MNSKVSLRADLLAKRKHLSASEVAARSVRVCENLRGVSLPESSIVAAYVSMRNEVDVFPYVKQLWARQIPVCMPVVTEAEKNLKFLAYSENSPLIKGAFGVMVPEGYAQLVPQVVLCPLVGFTRGGSRLGYGGGYYDATLRALRAQNGNMLAVGVAFDFQELAEIPHEAHDEKLNVIVTEGEVILCQ